jgi:hypothetical protein
MGREVLVQSKASGGAIMSSLSQGVFLFDGDKTLLDTDDI